MGVLGFISIILTCVASCSMNISIERLSVTNYHNIVGIPNAVYIKNIEDVSSEHISTRIIGGTFVHISEIPYQVGLLIKLTEDLTSVCGGSLISNTRIITAAHCHNDDVYTAKRYTAILGSNRLYSGGTRVNSNDIVVHPDWSPRLLTNDIAILRISSVDFSDTIQPISLPNAGAQDVSGLAMASGYGITSDGASIDVQENVSYVNLTILTNSQCIESYGSLIKNTMICTSGDGSNAPCSGDSGGPLSVNRDGTRILIGVTSFGAEETCLKYPTVYTRVSFYISWIYTV